MTPKSRNSFRNNNPALMRAIYWAIMIGIIAVFAVITLEAIVGIVEDVL